jgi:hypothetical protein
MFTRDIQLLRVDHIAVQFDLNLLVIDHVEDEDLLLVFHHESKEKAVHCHQV